MQLLWHSSLAKKKKSIQTKWKSPFIILDEWPEIFKKYIYYEKIGKGAALFSLKKNPEATMHWFWCITANNLTDMQRWCRYMELKSNHQTPWSKCSLVKITVSWKQWFCTDPSPATEKEHNTQYQGGRSYLSRLKLFRAFYFLGSRRWWQL